MPAVRRLLRIAFNALAAMMLVAGCVFWRRSVFFQERIAFTTDHRYFAVRTNPGTLTFEIHHYPVSPFDPGWHGWHSSWRPHWSLREQLGGKFSLRSKAFIIGLNAPPDYSIPDKSSWLNTGWMLDLPFWLITLASATPFACLAAHAQRNRLKRRRNACPTCGYDLRATPDRCPECGSAPTSGGAPE